MLITVDNVVIKLTDEQIANVIKESNKPEFEYPIFKQHRPSGRNKNIGAIVKFTSLRTLVAMTSDFIYEAGENTVVIDPHTDSNVWENVAYDKERDLYDTQPIMCWNDADTHRRMNRFYNAITKCTFKYDGKRYGMDYKNYEAIQLNEIPQWMIKTQKTLTIEL